MKIAEKIIHIFEDKDFVEKNYFAEIEQISKMIRGIRRDIPEIDMDREVEAVLKALDNIKYKMVSKK